MKNYTTAFLRNLNQRLIGTNIRRMKETTTITLMVIATDGMNSKTIKKTAIERMAMEKIVEEEEAI